MSRKGKGPKPAKPPTAAYPVGGVPAPKLAKQDDHEDDGHPLNPFRISPTATVVGHFDSYSFEPGAKFVALHWFGAAIVEDEPDSELATQEPIVRINSGFTARLIARSHTVHSHGVTVTAEIVRTAEHDAEAPLLDELLTLAKEQAEAAKAGTDAEDDDGADE